MKTTLEVPDELYRRVKARAAMRRRRIKDFVEEGLRLALEADERGLATKRGPLAVMEEIRERPLYSAEAVDQMIEGALLVRRENWRDED
jgi:hypothetical protein